MGGGEDLSRRRENREGVERRANLSEIKRLAAIAGRKPALK